jgi:GTP-binding protein
MIRTNNTVIHCLQKQRAITQRASLLQHCIRRVPTRSFNAFNNSNVRMRTSNNNNSRHFSTNVNYKQQAEPQVETKDVPHIRNLAIIAHVDHGKTTLVDCLLKQTNTVKNSHEERAMDSLSLEKERGITIMSKLTTVQYKDHTLNIVDTPGHADFGGEVERIMGMVDGVCLIVDATEGPMTQTKFVLAKALENGLKPVVILNKADRDTRRIGEVENEIFDLFVNLDATDEQLDFPILYASAREGWAVADFDKDERKDMSALFEAIIGHVPCPKAKVGQPFQMLISSLDYDRVFGRILTGKIYSGSVKVNDKVKGVSRTGDLVEEGKVFQLMETKGLTRISVKEAHAGSIISIAGFSKTGVTDTICHPKHQGYIETRPLDPPILSVFFRVNDSPLAGQDGKASSATQLRNRLIKESEINVALKIQQSAESEAFEVLGRGEMQIAVLIENLRREGYEFQISPPRPLFKEQDGKRLEPIEEVFIEVDGDDASTILDKMTKRKGELQSYTMKGNRAKLVYHVPTRALVGFGSEFRTETHGSGIMNHVFHSYQEYKGPLLQQRKGVMVSLNNGPATPYALSPLEERGLLFVKPTNQIYEGMIVGENARDQDIEVNPCKEKHLTNMRVSGKEDAIRLNPVRTMPLEEMLAYIQQDELLEVTPNHLRMRKMLLNSQDRKQERRKMGSK